MTDAESRVCEAALALRRAEIARMEFDVNLADVPDTVALLEAVKAINEDLAAKRRSVAKATDDLIDERAAKA